MSDLKSGKRYSFSLLCNACLKWLGFTITADHESFSIESTQDTCSGCGSKEPIRIAERQILLLMLSEGSTPEKANRYVGSIAAMDDLHDRMSAPTEAFESADEARGFGFQEMRDKGRRWRLPSTCVVPDCRRPSIVGSHTIQKNGPLSLIAEDRHVLTPVRDPVTRAYELKRVSVEQASTFPGYCTEHETIFAEFERRKEMRSDADARKQLFRTICREVVRKRSEAETASSAAAQYGLRVETLWREILRTRSAGDHEDTVRLDHEKLGRLRAALQSVARAADEVAREIERDFLVLAWRDVSIPKSDNLRYFVCRIGRPLPVSLTGYVTFEAECRGGRVEKVRIFMSVLPEDDSMLVCIAFAPSSEWFANKFVVDRLKESTASAIGVIETWMVRGTDHWFVRPSAWRALPEESRKLLLSDLADSDHGIVDSYPHAIF